MSKKTPIKIIEFPPGEYAPIFVAATDLDKVIIGANQKTWANHRHLGIGCEYILIGGKIYYEIAKIKEMFSKCAVKTTGDLERPQEKTGDQAA